MIRERDCTITCSGVNEVLIAGDTFATTGALAGELQKLLKCDMLLVYVSLKKKKTRQKIFDRTRVVNVY